MTKTIPCVFIEYANKEHVDWWNDIGSKLVRSRTINEVVETETSKPIGVIIGITGLLASAVIHEVNSYHQGALTEMVL